MKQNRPKEADELSEVHRRGAGDAVDSVFEGAAELISVETVICFEVSDRRFDSGAAFHPAPDPLRGFTSSAFIHDHPVIDSLVVAPVAHVDVNRFLTRYQKCPELNHEHRKN